MTSLHVTDLTSVSGVAVLTNALYVARERSSTTLVFDSRPPFGRQEDIKVQGLKSAVDITVCSKPSQLFIAVIVQCAIWRVNLLSIEPADKFITIQWHPLSLSVNSSRL